jgi:LPXTG-motif cell wall-anchored protein
MSENSLVRNFNRSFTLSALAMVLISIIAFVFLRRRNS